MSLITQCPACTTLFKVVPDQLRVSDGWVRCGQCDEVFDANAHLQTTLQEARQSSFGELPKRTPVAPQPAPSFVEKSPSSAAVVDSLRSPAQEYGSSVSPAHAISEDEERSASKVQTEVAVEADDLDVEAAVLAEYEALKNAEDLEDVFVASPEQEQEQEQEQEPEPEPEPEPGDPPLSFMRSVAAPAKRSRPWVRPALWVLSVGLSLALVMHAVVRERDWIAVKLPVTKNLIVAGCSLLGCQVSPLREIESVVIDSSSFVKVRTDVYRVHFTLKNTAFTEVATPALELTLTNTLDQPIARRIFLPSELGVSSEAIPAGGELIVALPLSVKLPNNAERVSGYRLLVFYP